MKKALLILILATFCYNSQSQVWWTKAMDDLPLTEVVYTDIVSDSIIVISGNENLGCTSNFLTAFDLDGNKLWHKSSDSSMRGPYLNTTTYNGYIFTAGFSQHNCVSSFDSLSINKYSPSGELILKKTYSFYDNDNYYLPTYIDANENNILISIMDYNNNYVVWLCDDEGVVIREIQYDLEIRSLRFYDNNNFLMVASDVLLLNDLEGNIISEYEFNEEIVQTLVFDNFIYVLFTDCLIKMNANLEIIDTVINSEELVFTNIKSFDNKLWIMGMGTNNIAIAEVTDAIEFEYFDIFADSPDFVVTKDLFIITGNSYSNQIALYSYHKTEEAEQYIWPDIELIDFYIDNIELYYTSSGYPRSYYFDAHVTIRNNSEEMLESFVLFSELDFGIHCWQQHYFNVFTDVGLLPGEEYTISAYKIHEEKPPSEDNVICFEILAPNSKIELNVDNNIVCKTFEILNTEDISISELISVYPNPFKNILNIELKDIDAEKIQIININGSVVFESNAVQENIVINLSELKQGFYILTIFTDKGRIKNKLIKR
ncbi:MAG: T9SS type A sorting domain-containing protein [Bacteroidota bacterium]